MTREQFVAGLDGFCRSRETPDTEAYEILAAEGDMGILHWRASCTNSGTSLFRELEGILMLEFAPDRRCRKLSERR